MTRTDPAPTDPAPAGRRRLIVLVVGGAVLAAAALIGILLIGVRSVPDFPELAERTDQAIQGRFAVIRWPGPEGEELGGPCLEIIEADGATRSLACATPDGSPSEFEFPAWFGWDDDGHLLLATFTPGNEITVRTVDADTGETISERTVPSDTKPPDTRTRDDGAVVGTEQHSDGTAVVWIDEPDGGRRTLLEVRGPDGYSFYNAAWSQRGDHVIVNDSERRAIVVSATGEPDPTVVADDVDQIAWYQPE
jgi:dipeptidyl aminopeptidase/acylaminoacyl peptidase